ncbi:hypothetical protein Pan216_31990 [Planctomycetes bacterium Pan216]|uniref:SGNH hydrolase-type esterase domain-containing protein n=1 Tax=Kolteria novifilia TaxID=2527975 RepID=A0A518B5X8_9BACT|nr:hypothetical protein Pan216_31990 [Planctomycetes bacterium Pan216]
MYHLVLLGDSIFDNAAYVEGAPAVEEQLREVLPDEWEVTLLARDGDVILGVVDQLEDLPETATHLVISAGGNNALGYAPIVSRPVGDSRRTLSELVAAQREFRDHYRSMLDAVHGRRLPTIGCTIYDAVPGLSAVESMALSLFNDVITKELGAAGIPLLDLRLVCAEPSDYAAISPIEPSEQGGMKIARAIGAMVVR